MIDRVWSCRFINISGTRHRAKRLWQMIDSQRFYTKTNPHRAIWVPVWIRACTQVCVYVSVVKGLPLISQNVKRYWKQPFPCLDRVNISLTPESAIFLITLRGICNALKRGWLTFLRIIISVADSFFIIIPLTERRGKIEDQNLINVYYILWSIDVWVTFSK